MFFKVSKFLQFFLLIFPINSFSIEKSVIFHGGYAFETLEGQRANAVYLSVFNYTENDIKIKVIDSNLSEKTEIHEVVVNNDIVKMKKINSLAIKSKSEFYFQPGGTHIMLMGLKKKMIDGDTFKLSFQIDDGSIKQAEVIVLNKRLRENYLN